MPRYLVMEQAMSGELTAQPRRDMVDAPNIKAAIATARGMDDKGHTYAATKAVRLFVVEVAGFATIDLLHHLPTVAGTEAMQITTYTKERKG